MSYKPPFTVTAKAKKLIAEITKKVERLSVSYEQESNLRLRRINRIRTIQGSLAIEGNTLSTQQITAILEGKPVIAPPREILEARNALAAYEQFADWQAGKKKDLLVAHLTLMQGLIDDAGHYRNSGVGVMKGKQVVHMAPPAERVNKLMADLLNWVSTTKEHPLIVSSVFHYEFEFIHPFSDGNGRMGRLWQTLILSLWKPIFKDLPIESMVYAQQSDYYQAIQKSTKKTDSGPFIEYMLSAIDATLNEILLNEAESDQVSDQVKRLLALLAKHSTMTLNDMLKELSLKHRPSFRKNYLQPALHNSWIEMTQPDSPQSPTQKYRLTELGRNLISRN